MVWGVQKHKMPRFQHYTYFLKNVPVTQVSSERALKTMSEIIWKGAAALEDFQKKNTEGTESR